jgi:MerR family transcriptional regulator, light-induced transcriptional regulator
MPMKTILTPKDLADAIGVSESSLRRWVDSGAIRTSRTPGGHRRIALAEAIRFVRSTRAAIVRPELLGLSELANAPMSADEQQSVNDRVLDMMKSGDASRVRSIILSLYMSGSSMAALCDGPIRYAMHRLGELWQHSSEGVLMEHRATDLAVQVISHLRQMVGDVSSSAPVAMGGAHPTDPYVLPTAMAALVLADAGYRPTNFGPLTPVSLLPRIASEHAARLIWISLSVPPTASFTDDLVKLCQQVRKAGTQVVLGGRCALEVDLSGCPNAQVLASMSELWAFAQGLLVPVPATAN